MTGHNVYYPVGYDDNGIPTEILVHKELGDQAKDMDRKTFVKACLEVTGKYRDIYKSLRQSVGMSFDRSMTYSTISPFVQKIAQQIQVILFRRNYLQTAFQLKSTALQKHIPVLLIRQQKHHT